jgi:hypothetical protein
MTDRPKKKVSKLTFEIITTDVWDDEGIQEIADEFAEIYGGNLNIDSAGLVSAEVIDEPEDDTGFDDDDDDEEEG